MNETLVIREKKRALCRKLERREFKKTKKDDLIMQRVMLKDENREI